MLLLRQYILKYLHIKDNLAYWVIKFIIIYKNGALKVLHAYLVKYIPYKNKSM